MTADLATWLRAQLDTDAAYCRELGDFLSVAMAADLPTHPERVLSGINAVREVITVHVDQRECERCTWLDDEFYACETLRLLALPYADRAGYDQGWRP